MNSHVFFFFTPGTGIYICIERERERERERKERDESNDDLACMWRTVDLFVMVFILLKTLPPFSLPYCVNISETKAVLGRKEFG